MDSKIFLLSDMSEQETQHRDMTLLVPSRLREAKYISNRESARGNNGRIREHRICSGSSCREVKLRATPSLPRESRHKAHA